MSEVKVRVIFNLSVNEALITTDGINYRFVERCGCRASENDPHLLSDHRCSVCKKTGHLENHHCRICRGFHSTKNHPCSLCGEKGHEKGSHACSICAGIHHTWEHRCSKCGGTAHDEKSHACKFCSGAHTSSSHQCPVCSRNGHDEKTRHDACSLCKRVKPISEACIISHRPRCKICSKRSGIDCKCDDDEEPEPELEPEEYSEEELEPGEEREPGEESESKEEQEPEEPEPEQELNEEEISMVEDDIKRFEITQGLSHRRYPIEKFKKMFIAIGKKLGCSPGADFIIKSDRYPFFSIDVRTPSNMKIATYVISQLKTVVCKKISEIVMSTPKTGKKFIRVEYHWEW